MCAAYQLSFDDLKEIRNIADQITNKFGKEESTRLRKRANLALTHY